MTDSTDKSDFDKRGHDPTTGLRDNESIVEQVRSRDVDSLADGTIAAFGYVAVYRRVLGALMGVCFVIAMSSPLGAIMLAAEYQIHFAGYWGLSWGWIIPNLMMLPQVIAIAEICSSMPVNGGFYWWAAALAPHRWSRAVAFIIGWFNLLSLATALAAFAYAVAAGLAQIIGYMTNFTPNSASLMAMSMGVITLWAVLMAFPLEKVNIVMMVSAIILALQPISMVIALPIIHSQKGIPFATSRDVFTKFTNSSDWTEGGIAVPFSFYTCLFTNSIWTAPAYVAEETHDAKREAPKAIVLSFGCTALLGLATCVVFAYCIPDMDSLAAGESGYPLFVVVFDHFGDIGASVFLTVGSIFGLIGGSGMLLTYATQVAAFARDNGLPYSSFLSRVHRGSNMPLAAAGLLVCLTYLFLLFSLSTYASDVVYSMSTLASLVIWAAPIGFRLCAGDKWVPGPFYTGRFSWSIHLVGFLSTVYFLITRSFPAERGTIPVNIVVVLGTLFVSIVAFFALGSGFRGLDLVALEAWRHENKQNPDGGESFAAIIR